MPPAVFRYFWLLTLGIVLVNVALWHRRADTLVRQGRITEAERHRFTWGAALTLGGFCALVQTIVWITGESRPACLGAFPPTTPASIASSLLTLVAWAALLWWVWRGRGAERLARLGPALLPRPLAKSSHTSRQVRRFVTGFVIVAVVGGIIASRIAPPPPDCAAGTTGQTRTASDAGHTL